MATVRRTWCQPTNMPTKTVLNLESGSKMPTVGLGTWQATDESELETALNTALEHGYRHIDTAFAYQNEALIGKTLQKWFESGKLKRENLFITTKLPATAVRPEKVEEHLKMSLKNLALDYVDLYLVHFPVCLDYTEGNIAEFMKEDKLKTLPRTDHVGVWKEMEKQVDAGRAKNIGLSNYTIAQIETVLKSARIKPANLQIEIHVFFQQNPLVDFCHKNGITVVAYSPLANPGYNNFLKKMGKEERVLPNILINETIAKIAQKHGKTPAQIALKFLLQRDIAVIPKSVTAKRIAENFAVYDFELSADEMKQLKALDVGEEARVCDFSIMKGLSDHPDFPVPQKKAN